MSDKSGDQPLRGHTALVTGATSGIGHHAALNLANAGAHVIITGRNQAGGENAAAAINANPDPAA